MSIETKGLLSRGRTGRGIRIAVLDSGINPYHSHVNGVTDGIQFVVNRNRQLECKTDYRDRLGHGTAVAAVIRGMAPQAELYAVKIFDDKLATYPSVLITALEWALEQKVHIVNLSLGLTRDIEAVREVCARVVEAGICLVASLDERNQVLWPASYPGVFGVCAGDYQRGEWGFYKDGYFSSCGYPRELKGDVQRFNLHGHSFASAHFSGLLALLLEEHPRWGSQEVWDYLVQIKQKQQ